MTEAKANNAWLGPVLGALVLVGGYVAYQEWSKDDAHDEMCAALARRFSVNFTGMMESGAIERSLKEGTQAPMAELGPAAAANQEVMYTLDSECPGWRSRPIK